MDIKQLCADAHAIALEKGWYDPPKSFGEMILMCHTELSEVVEEYRNAQVPEIALDIYYTNVDNNPLHDKPNGVPVELADLVIRVCDLCEHYDIDLETAIEKKMAYNRTRSYRHGNKSL